MKLCKDCRHAVAPVGGEEHKWVCSHSSSLFERISYVTGERLADQIACGTARQLGECGAEAKHWTSKTPRALASSEPCRRFPASSP